MKRKNLYWSTTMAIYVVSAYIIGKYFTHDVFGGMVCAIPCFVIGYLIAAMADGYLTSRYPTFLYTPYDEKIKAVMKRQEKRSAEEAKLLQAVENELLYPYNSLSRKYKFISDFCFEHPRLINRLKESEKYIIWRTDVLDWAKSNLYRLDGFYFNDGIVDYVYDSNCQTNGMIDLNLKYGYPQEPARQVDCDIDFKNKHLPEDYFEFPGLVWESEDIDVDEYVIKRQHPAAAESLSFGIGLAAGLELFSSKDGNCSNGNDAGDCGGLS